MATGEAGWQGFARALNGPDEKFLHENLATSRSYNNGTLGEARVCFFLCMILNY
jgi:hypothetical protein